MALAIGIIKSLALVFFVRFWGGVKYGQDSKSSCYCEQRYCRTAQPAYSLIFTLLFQCTLLCLHGHYDLVTPYKLGCLQRVVSKSIVLEG